MLDVVQDTCLALSGQTEMLATMKQTAKVSSKRKRLIPADIRFAEESTASSTLTTKFATVQMLTVRIILGRPVEMMLGLKMLRVSTRGDSRHL